MVARDYVSGKLSAVTQPRDFTTPYIPTPIYVHNDAGSEIPAWACMQVTGTEEQSGQNYLLVDQPADSDGSSGWYLFNGPYAIAANGNGVAQYGAVVRGYKNSGTITAGERWQPVASQWYIEQNDEGIFVAVGADDIGTDVLKVMQRGGGGGASSSKIAYAGSGITARSGTTAGSATVTEYKLTSGVLGTNTTTFTAYNLSQHAIPAGSYVLCTQESISNFWIATPPGIINLRLDSGNLQYTYDGTNWTTWETTTTCT